MKFSSTARAILSGGTDGKAVLRPAAAEPRPALFGPPVTRRMQQRNSRTHMSTYTGDNAVDWVRNAVAFWANAASNAEYHFEHEGERMKLSSDKGKSEDYPGGIVPASLEGLMAQPNPFQTYDEMMWFFVADLLLAGNHYWLKYRVDEQGRPLALYRLAPPFMTIVPGERSPVDRFEYHVDGQPEPLIFGPDEVIHFKMPNPNDDVYGAGIIASGPRVIDIELSLVETMAQFFEQGAKLSGVVTSDRSVPDPLVQKIERQFRSMYSGARNAYKVAVLERGLNFSPIQPTAAEAQFTELTKLGRDRVYDMFGMHPALINGDAARPGLLEEAQRNFDNKHMKPFLGKAAKAISTNLTHAWDGNDFKIDYEYEMPEKDRLTLAAVYSALPGVKVDEVREYVGLEPIGGDDGETLLNMPGVGTELGGTPLSGTPGVRGGRPANASSMAGVSAGAKNERTTQNASASRTRGALKKALEEGNLEDLEDILKDAEQEGKALTIQLTERTVNVLDKYRTVPKTERAQAVAELADALPGGQNQLRGRVIAHVAEGIRRGYTMDQIIDGEVADEFPGLFDRLSAPPQEVQHAEAA